MEFSADLRLGFSTISTCCNPREAVADELLRKMSELNTKQPGAFERDPNDMCFPRLGFEMWIGEMWQAAKGSQGVSV